MTEPLPNLPTTAFPALPLAMQEDDAVDLSDKEGVIDPADLKDDDPSPPPPPDEPPSPSPEPDVPPFDVDRGGIDDANRPIEQE